MWTDRLLCGTDRDQLAGKCAKHDCAARRSRAWGGLHVAALLRLRKLDGHGAPRKRSESHCPCSLGCGSACQDLTLHVVKALLKSSCQRRSLSHPRATASSLSSRALPPRPPLTRSGRSVHSASQWPSQRSRPCVFAFGPRTTAHQTPRSPHLLLQPQRSIPIRTLNFI